MEPQETKSWVVSCALEFTKQLAAQELKGPYHCDLRDDHGHGRVASFEISDGKVVWFNWNDNRVEVADYPLRLVVTSGDNEVRAAWIHERLWRPEDEPVARVVR